MQVKMQTLAIAAAVMMTMAGLTLTPGSAVAQNGELPGELLSSEEVPLSDMDGDGVSDAMDVCPDTTIPERRVPERVLLPGHYALTDNDTTFNTHRGRDSFYTLVDTRGCSCEQIIEMSGLAKSHKRFGCSRDVMRVFTAAMDALPPVQETVSTLEAQQCPSENGGGSQEEVAY